MGFDKKLYIRTVSETRKYFEVIETTDELNYAKPSEENVVRFEQGSPELTILSNAPENTKGFRRMTPEEVALFRWDERRRNDD